MNNSEKDTKILLIGSGRVATHLAVKLISKGIVIPLVVSRAIENAQLLASKIGANATSTIPKESNDFDFVILSVSDDAYEYYLPELSKFQNAIIVHTSGSVDMEVFKSLPNHGVLYPFQTFSFERSVDFSSIPIMIESNNADNLNKIKKLAHVLSPNVMEINSHQRAIIHVAAVFVCNFVNHLYVEAEALLKSENIDFSILHSLMKETSQKAIELSPTKAQTGPAMRKDINIINKHLDLITDEKSRDLYLKISNLIIEKTEKT